MNPIVKAQVDKCSELYESSDLSQSEQFEIYSIFSIFQGTLKENIQPLDIWLRGKEFGIDGATCLLQGEICKNTDDVHSISSVQKRIEADFYFIQSKTGATFDYGDISKFFDAVYRFFQGGMEGESDQLDDLIVAKDAVLALDLKSNPTLCTYFVSTGDYNETAVLSALINETKEKLNSLNIFSKIELEFTGATQLQEAFRTATNSVSRSIEFLDTVDLPEHSNVGESLIGLVAGENLVKLASTEDGQIDKRVFFDNIRDFDPDSSINNAMIQELTNGDKLAFGYRNNGVTVVANSVKKRRKIYDLEDFQIVNGCQTTNVLYCCKENLKEVFVPFRLIESNKQDFISSVILGTNKQNQVGEEQFLALKPFLKDLEEYCKSTPTAERIYIERRDNQYLGQSLEKTRIFKPREVVKAVAATIMQLPNRSPRDYRKLLIEFSDKVFQDNHNVSIYHASCLLSHRFDFLIRNRRIDRSQGIYKFYVLAAAARKRGFSDKIFQEKPNKIETKASQLVNLAKDETQFLEESEYVIKELEKLVSAKTNTDREKLRDTIRSDKFLSLYNESLEIDFLK